MAYLDDIHTRLSALIAGTYPAVPGPGDRVVPSGTFRPGKVFLPAQNAQFPRVVVTREFDLVYHDIEYDTDDPNSENQHQSPHVRRVLVDVRIQYTIETPNGLAPRDRTFALGAMTTATLRAMNDGVLLEWVLAWQTSWAGVAIGCTRTGRIHAERADDVRAVLTVPLEILAVQNVTSSPGAWS